MTDPASLDQRRHGFAKRQDALEHQLHELRERHMSLELQVVQLSNQVTQLLQIAMRATQESPRPTVDSGAGADH